MGIKEKKETVLQQRCPSCQSLNFHIYHYLRSGHHDRLYLECSQCGTFVGRVIVHAFVDPLNANAEYRSFLREAQANDNQSGRKTVEDFKKHSEKAIEQFAYIKEIPPVLLTEEKILRDWYDEYSVKEDG